MSDFWVSKSIKKSRKPHRCAHCDEKIEVGSSYSREIGLWEGDFQDYALCLRCMTLLNSHDPIWESDGELGNFHEKLMDSHFVNCSHCGQRDMSEFRYFNNGMSIEIECAECDKKFIVDLSAENLLKKE